MKKRDYVKPSMEVFECEQQQQLLAGSGGVKASRSADTYGEAEEVWND